MSPSRSKIDLPRAKRPTCPCGRGMITKKRVWTCTGCGEYWGLCNCHIADEPDREEEETLP